jgi:endonuclease/exonuclease/phosphatase family metal-dependent hydrolase
VAGRVGGLVSLTIGLTLALQSLRALFPIAYSYREQSGLTSTTLIVLAVFVAPVVAVPLHRAVGPRVALFTAAAALAAMRLVLQDVARVTIGLAAVTAAVGLVMITTALIALRGRRAELALAIVCGLALDTVLRSAWATWDVVWHHGVAAWIVTTTLAAAMVIGAAFMREADRGAPGASALPAVVLGPFLALQLLFLQSPAFVASSGHVSLAAGVAIVLTGDLVALGAIAVLVARPPIRSLGVAFGVALAVLGFVLPAAVGLSAVVAVLVGQALATCLLTIALGGSLRERSHGTMRDAGGVVTGALVLGSTVFLYQLHYDQPLPVSNRWLPCVAGALMTLAALATRPSRARVPSRAFVALAGSLAVVTVAIGCGLALSAPDLSPAEPTVPILRVVTYNPHSAVTRDGQLDPAAVARALDALHPDVVILEEVGRGWPLSSSVDLAQWLQRRLGLPYVWAPGADHQFGNLLLSRVPVLDAKVVDLPRGSGTMNRSAVIAHVGPVAGKTMTVIGTHLQNGSSASRKATRVAEIHKLLRAWGQQPRTVLAGDLNSDPGSVELRTLLDAGFNTTQPTGACTLKTSNNNCVDWILVTADVDQSAVRTLKFDTFDHRPLIATVQPH